VIRDLTRETVLITGGTMGIGLACAHAFAARGAKCVLTYKWGTADEDAVREGFARIGAPAPDIFRADAGNAEDTQTLMRHLKETASEVGVFVSNVSAALVVGGLKDYSAKALFRSIEYSAWPMVDYTLTLGETFGRYPRYVIGISSTGVEMYSRGYDFMAASKAVMETLCRYLSYRLEESGVRINVVRSCNVKTLALEDTFGKEFAEFASHFIRDEHFIQPEEVGNVVLSLASGLLDGMSGQIVTVDRGMTFFDNILRMYEERERLGL
jgi:NAD(P)-dependent dehydrogenase (short-subunit alcohol dehydrogenase family)